MKKITLICIAILLIQNNSFAEEKINCKDLKKISQKIACKAKSVTKGIGGAVKKVGSGVKRVGSDLVPEKLKNKNKKVKKNSFSNKKTLADFFKKKDK
tara:strand:+ start:253 stop:546 length:294 start_codon:yes stop_codon:yes gene_type:complete